MLEEEWPALPRGCLPLPEPATPCCKALHSGEGTLLSNREEKGGHQKGRATCSEKWSDSISKLHAPGTCLYNSTVSLFTSVDEPHIWFRRSLEAASV